MSDDEDELDERGTKTNRYISRRPAWRSDVMQCLLEAVDQVADPKTTSKYTARVAGPVKDEPPPVATTLKNRARRWMVSEEWLATESNKEYDVPPRIAGSGKAWGDAEDPEALEEKKRKMKEEKEDVKRKKVRLSDVGEKTKKKGKAKTGGGTQVERASETPGAEDSDAAIDPELRGGRG
ncbi:hypothetical protein GLOTRDRAFT_67208 [Gloeophyllum trabeum ATCC 11539]|uniref:Uncharacterized protein n=1 Tax=Gloeophyllum trabeum (strain ATCC 11539 / FP-39264 / Madison 617) TaxID=670483 RepID=S7R5R1_GLOTA|nr:uncharacterized protein GLOTRDRAFT_67208 [Gloeophyllum trabeum ATCC 11539]EPQ49720.1 hypothetical protein GLOTRDRAFT_67208 [Gloeophyllum trabeum ATCC 11539]